MSTPIEPRNPRVVYPDGTVILIRKLWYGAHIGGTHVWVANDPDSVPWSPGVRTECDSPDGHGPHTVLVWYDMKD